MCCKGDNGRDRAGDDGRTLFHGNQQRLHRRWGPLRDDFYDGKDKRREDGTRGDLIKRHFLDCTNKYLQNLEPEKCEMWKWVDWEELRTMAEKFKSGGDEAPNLFLPLVNLFDQHRGISLSQA